MKKFLILFLIFMSSLITSCSKEKFTYNEETNQIYNENRNCYYMTTHNWELLDVDHTVGKVKIGGQIYTIYTDKNELYFNLAKILTKSKERNLYIKEGIKLPTLSEMTNYKILYNNKIYQYDLLKYYFSDGNIINIDAPYNLLSTFIVVEGFEELGYQMDICEKDDCYYIENFQNKYVEIDNIFKE